MSAPNDNNHHEDSEDLDFFQTVTEDLYNQLVETIEGEKVVGLALWEESIADEEDASVRPAQRDVFDFDLYLENNLYLELYAVYVFQDLDSDPLRGLDPVGKIFSTLIEDGVWLDEIAVSDDDDLVLILSRNHEPQLYLNVGGWSLEEWDTLPEED